MIKPENRFDFSGYIASRKISDNDLALTCGYCNGSGWISGIAFDHLIKVRFNYFENSCGVHMVIDEVEINNIVSFFALKRFFKTGILIGHDDPMMRPVKDMHWHLWEAVVIDLGTLQTLKLAPPDLVKEAADISSETRAGDQFTASLRERACKVEFEIEKYRKELDEHYDKEQAELANA